MKTAPLGAVDYPLRLWSPHQSVLVAPSGLCLKSVARAQTAIADRMMHTINDERKWIYK
jgi:hypothetical protein